MGSRITNGNFIGIPPQSAPSPAACRREPTLPQLRQLLLPRDNLRIPVSPQAPGNSAPLLDSFKFSRRNRTRVLTAEISFRRSIELLACLRAAPKVKIPNSRGS